VIRKGDMVLLAAALAAGAVAFAVNAAAQAPGATVKVVLGHEVYGTYELAKDQEIAIDAGDGAWNVLVISNGTASMKEANCPNGDCTRQHGINRTGQCITCLPNKVLVSVEGAAKGEFDSIVH